MSQNEPPSPMQPKVVTSAMNSMAQLPRPSIPGAPYFSRRSAIRQPPTSPLAVTQPQSSLQPIDQDDCHRVPDQTPPVRALATRETINSRCAGNPLSISNLLNTEFDLRSSLECKNPSPLAKLRRFEPLEDYGSSIYEGRSRIISYPPSKGYHSSSQPASWRADLERIPGRTQYTTTRSEPDCFQPSPASIVRSPPLSHCSSSPKTLSPASRTPSYAVPTFPSISQSPPLLYQLSIRQQPIAARACGFGERDRRVIDPPPILELKITDKATGAPEQDSNAMLALHCMLVGADGFETESINATPPVEIPAARRLMGTLVASPYQAKDEYGLAGTFFVFSDLSCRTPGRFRLQFRLLRVDPMMMQPGAQHSSVASVETDVFTVYTAKDFPGMRASTNLLTALRGQGLNVGLKKGTEARITKGKKRKGSESSDEDGESESNERETSFRAAAHIVH